MRQNIEPMESFSTFDVVKAIGVTRNQLKQWLEARYLNPSIERANGPDTRNRFSRADVYRIELYRRLLEIGFARNLAADLLNRMDSKKAAEAASFTAASIVRMPETYPVFKNNLREAVESGIKYFQIFRHIGRDINYSFGPSAEPEINLDSKTIYVVLINLEAIVSRVDTGLDGL